MMLSSCCNSLVARLAHGWMVVGLLAAVVGGIRPAAAAEMPAVDGPPQTWPALVAVDDRSEIPIVKADKLICFTLYTVQGGVLKLSAQLYPLKEDEPHEVMLDLRRGSKWVETATASVHPVGWTATFRLAGWDSSKDVDYRVRHPMGAVYTGKVRHDPVDKDIVVAAAFTGNSPGPGGGKISKEDVVDSVRQINPDVLLFTGDQVYDHLHHTAAWLEFGRTFGELTRDRPTVTIPDDHDVGQGNLWGGGGRKVEIDTQGGYTRPAEYVKMVERQQTSHLPDPYDPTPIGQGIGVYYSRMVVGGIDFAIVEDRKFKSGCYDFKIVDRGWGPRPDHITVAEYDPEVFDAEGKKLLGDRQLRFLGVWATDWSGVVMKSVVSQTVFGMTSTFHSKNKTHYLADFDANGWPQTGRNRAVEAMRRCAAFHICGDQHLATLGQYGIEQWRDGGWWFCVPSIANLWPRWWQPKEKGGRPEPGAQEFTGDFLDGFGNKMTIYAHTNPRPTTREPVELHERMPGFGVVRFDKPDRTITIECWPRMVGVNNPQNQYRGWPRTISQFDNDPRPAFGYLPMIEVRGGADPVVEVVDEETGSLLYAVRIKGNFIQPRVFGPGMYTVHVIGGRHRRTLEGLQPVPRERNVLRVVDLR